MKPLEILATLSLAGFVGHASAAAKTYQGRIAHGTVGLGLTMYDPICTYMCRNSASGWMLNCGDGAHDGHRFRRGSDDAYEQKEKRHDMGHMMPSPECYANNDPFLQTLAYCISTHCDETVTLATIETYWENNVAGNLVSHPLPKYSYQEALSRVEEPPEEVVDAMEVLNRTSLVDEWLYQAHWGANWGIEKNMAINNRYTLVLILTCSLIPILLSLLRFLPLPESLVAKLYAHLIDPPVIGSKHAVPVFFGLGIAPTRGQALFIAYIWIINIVLSAVSYVFTWPNLWYTEKQQLVACSIGNRVGMLSFGNLALAILYASRNNVLLWATNWSRSTYVLVHRWLAVICVIQAFLHSVIYLGYQGDLGGGMLEAEAKLPYYYWGINGTIALVILLPISILPIRTKVYEIFLTGSGYEIWVALSFALWGFDRFLARPLRLAKNGIKRAHVTIIDGDYLKVNVPGVEATGQAYLYFPSITWRVWENHPFSVITVPGRPKVLHERSSAASEDLEPHSKEVGISTSTQLDNSTTAQPGIVFFIRRRGGLTRSLAAHADVTNGIPVLVESSYGAELSLLHSPKPRPSLAYPNLIVIAGGVGITGVLPLLTRGFLSTEGTTKLFWGVRTEPLVRAVESMLGQDPFVRTEGEEPSKTTWREAEVHVSIGRRFNLVDVLESEISTAKGVKRGTLVVVCGPPGMSDDVRTKVTDLATRGAVVRFAEERFGW